MVVPTAAKLRFSLVRVLGLHKRNKVQNSREVDDEDDETELAVERSLM